MGLRTTVKAGNISNLSDARYCAGMGVHYLGFSIDPVGSAYVDPASFKSIKEWVVGPLIVGEYDDPEPSMIRKALEEYELDCLEIGNAALLDDLADLDIPVILKVDLTSIASPSELEMILQEYHEKVRFFLLDKSSIDPPPLSKEDIGPLARRYKIMMSFPLDHDHLETWLAETDIIGIALKGGVEEVTGFKDYDELADILEELETD